MFAERELLSRVVGPALNARLEDSPPSSSCPLGAGRAGVKPCASLQQPLHAPPCVVPGPVQAHSVMVEFIDSRFTA